MLGEWYRRLREEMKWCESCRCRCWQDKAEACEQMLTVIVMVVEACVRKVSAADTLL